LSSNSVTYVQILDGISEVASAATEDQFGQAAYLGQIAIDLLRKPNQGSCHALCDGLNFGRNAMAIIVKPTRTDIAVARAIARNTNADEHVLSGLAAGWWIWCRNRPAEQRRTSDHVLLITLAATFLPHILKTTFDQERPDRLTVRGHLHGVPLSGKARDAFPSGHAIHIGALTSAATELPPRSATRSGLPAPGWC
jgi:undecaprenyl-diphosphatase